MDEGTTLSAFVESRLRDSLSGRPSAPAGGPPPLAPLPIIYVDDMDHAQTFFHSLGLRTRAAARSGAWMELWQGGTVALHQAADRPGRRHGTVELTLDAAEPLEAIRDRLQATRGGHRCSDITDVSLGRTMTVSDGDHLEITITEYDPDLYT